MFLTVDTGPGSMLINIFPKINRHSRASIFLGKGERESLDWDVSGQFLGIYIVF